MTSLIRYFDPLDRVFDRAFGAVLANGDANATSRSIALDVVETPEAYIVKAELPGIPKDKIEVNVEDRNVTIGASFSQEIDANGTQATHVDGVLQLTLPKVAKTNSKQITIQ